ncbi:MAG: xanthine dehydrogenase family protein molybdopterin-binding subunit [Armatimonadetes bacterium]|nr:xanthine dehydrogenase family protein molybdopterin-binding subunit [Armatimonadota bacterium]
MAKRKIKVPKVVNGMEQMVEIEVDDAAGPQWGDRSQMRLLNHHLPRVDGPDKVTGAAKYTHDIRLPGMLYGRILPSPHPKARVASLDARAAEAIPGVAAVLTFPNKTLMYQGDPVAAVAARTPELAEDAIRAIKVQYEPLPFVVDADEAMKPGAPQAHNNGPNVRPDESRGDADAVNALFAQCAAVAEGEYRTQFQHHACLETHGVVVDYRGGDTATVYSSTQGTFSVPGDAAQELGLDESKVTCIVHHMGGGFGSKFGLDLPGAMACRLAKKVNKPVHLMLTREDEFLMAGNRSASITRMKVGADKDGKLLALTAEQHRLGGLGDGSQRGQPYIYHAEHVHRTVDSVYTNIDSSRAFRGPGCPQASFPMESLLDELAAKLDLDPIEIRKRNTGDPFYARQMDIGAQKIGWAQGRNKQPGAGQSGMKKRGMGLGLAQWGGGGGPACQVTVKIAPDGGVDVSVGTQDLGTGTRTYTAAIVAEEFGLPLAAVRPHIGDSRLGNANASGGSTTAPSLAPAVKDAAYNARMALFARVAPALGAKPEDLMAQDGKVMAANGKALTWKQACAALGTQGVTAQGEWKPGLSDGGVHGVHLAEVEVDTETGKVQVLKLVGVQDCGLPLNRSGIESQLNGGLIQGMGYGLYEGKVTDRETGLMLNPNMEEYKLPGALEMPEFIPVIDDADTRGVIGMAEPGTIPTAGALANAIYNACGVRVRSLPITPDKILNGLAELNGKGA